MLGKLLNIQQELKAPKGQYNSFGKYKYRSCEDILESVKPLLKKYKCIITLTDELVVLGDNTAIHYTENYYDKDLKKENTRNIVENGQRYYIKATVTIYDAESKDSISNTAYAREEEFKKGMDGSQITGTASSYARKYALNGLFAIDDTKDADTDEYTKQTKAAKTEQKSSKKAAKDEPDFRKMLIDYCKENNIDMNKVGQDYGLIGRKLSNDDYYDVLCDLGWNGEVK